MTGTKGGHLRYEIWGHRRVYLSEWEECAKDYIRHHYGNLVAWDEPQLSPKGHFWTVPLCVVWGPNPQDGTTTVFYGVGELEVRITKDGFKVTKATSRRALNKRMDAIIARITAHGNEDKGIAAKADALQLRGEIANWEDALRCAKSNPKYLDETIESIHKVLGPHSMFPTPQEQTSS